MAPQQQQERGVIAILDALGAANYSEKEIARFLRSRELVLGLLNEKAETVLGEIDADLVTTFTFNDTVVVVYRINRRATLKDVQAFCTLLRKFIIDPLVHMILFRGSISIGPFYVNEHTNTVMGPAVTDAAAWYDRADWIGVNATPQATILIQSLIEQEQKSLEHLIVDYSVPLNDRSSVTLKAINWPKAFYVSNLTPCGEGEKPRAKCLALLAKHQVPKGTESKYINAIAFFDHVVRSQVQSRRATKPSAKAG